MIIQTPSEEIVFDVKCSQALEEMIVKYGGTPVIWKTGHSLIKEKMRQNNVRFAGEMSGHIFFADDYYGYDDAIYVGLRAAQTLSRTDKKLSELISTKNDYLDKKDKGQLTSEEKKEYKNFLIKYDSYKKLYNKKNHQNIVEVRRIIEIFTIELNILCIMQE